MVNGHKYPFGYIGNCTYNALIDDTANVGWLCFPRFDSDFVFGSMLDADKGGHFYIRPEWDDYSSSQRYLTNTNILETTFESEDGSFKVIDFAPRFQMHERFFKPAMLCRQIVPISGRPRIKISCKPVGDFGRKELSMTSGSNHLNFKGLGAELRLTTNISTTFIAEEKAFVLTDTRVMVLTWGSPIESALDSIVEHYLKKTSEYWQQWVNRTSTEYFNQPAVIRSALALKLMQYQDTGAIISAPTTSLTEFPASTRNWDFRFCWLRDSYYNIKAFNDLSHFGVLYPFANFIENILLSEDGRLHPFYAIGLNTPPKEQFLPLRGYKDERPVRLGNGAWEHNQNDVYGQVLLAFLPLFQDARISNPKKEAYLPIISTCLGVIEECIGEEDHGIWEFRGIRQEHCYTSLFHWAGSRAANKIAESVGNTTMATRAMRLSEAAAAKIEACYDANKGVYTQAIGNSNIDASSLQLINMGYLDPSSEKAKNHLLAVENELTSAAGLMYRYKHDDDFGTPQTTHMAVGFWWAEALAKVGRVEDAIIVFDRLQQFSNHLGLHSQDADERTGSQYGNFPLAMSHVALINAAFTISRKIDKPLYL